MGAASYKEKILIMAVLIMRTEITHLKKIMSKTSED
jgi:hypothetical protein